MNRNELLEMLDAGFKRFYNEGYSKWSKYKVIAAINPRGEDRDIDDPEIQSILKELESVGLICLKYDDDCYLEVLHD
ncbi:MAG: hypothetical protein A2Z20_04945 [Bdellovibrionales bacterium RBG_16_40_8]|nr:MAG: hypothetical protein A2Z20_04945 [Bdellovibrionales bacterium RBG_16_40_8]